MTLTEDEAKTKRCQESFGDTNVSPTGHAYSAHIAYGGSALVQTSPSYCIGSACMAWRWKRGEYDQGGQEIATHGFCGKAGQP